MQNHNTHVILGSGPLGRAVMNELIRQELPVRVLNRSGKIAEVPASVDVVKANILDPQALRALTADAAVVYFCAQPAYHRWVEEFPTMMAAVLEALKGSDLKMVFGDNLYMYGDPGGKPISEDLPTTAHTRKGKTRAALAETALQAHRSGDLRVSIGRGSDFFGPWVLDSTMGARAFYPAIQGKAAQLTGRVDQPHTHTFINDFGKALVTLGTDERAEGQVWHVPNDQPALTQQQFMQIAFEEIGLPYKASAMGPFMMRLGGLFIPAARETVEMMYEFQKPFVVDSSKFERAFGWKATPLKEALRETIAWYRSHPQSH